MIYGDIIYIVLETGLCILCFWMAEFAKRNCSSKFKLIYILPMLVTVFALAGCGFEKMLLPVYLFSILMLAGFFFEKRKLRRIFSVCLLVLTFLEIPLCLMSKSYRQPNYLAEFEEGFAVMQERYILSEHKEIDWETLYETYLPKFREVSGEYDAVENFILWQKFAQEFHDGHVYYVDTNQKVMDEAYQRMYGNDYGFSLFRREDGAIVAVNVEPGSKAELAGITNGTVIIKWDGTPVEEMTAACDVPLYYTFMPVQENDAFLRVVHAAGQGGQTLKLSFVGADGMEKETTIESMGFYYERLKDTLNSLLAGTQENNLSVKKLDGNTAMIRISAMSYDNESYNNGDYSKMETQLREDLQALKDDGVTDLIFDLRGNEGGDPLFNITIFKLLFPQEDVTICYDGVWDAALDGYQVTEEGRYSVGKAVSFCGEGLWGDGNMVVLVNANTISAGDMFTYVMSGLPNVTIMGITPSNCSCQGIRGAEFEKGYLSFSAVPNLTKEGEIFVDTDAGGVATISLDERILVDEEFIDAVFNRGEDYVLNQALEYLNEMN